MYNIPITTTESRIREGWNEIDCLLSEHDARSRAYTKGKIKVIDTITKKVMYFTNTRDPSLRKMFSDSAITKGTQTGEPTRITSLSKYKNPCIIKRI